MKTAQMPCDDQALETMLREELPQPEAYCLLDHVESCQHCQRRLEDLTASRDQWEKATDILASPDDSPVPSGVITLAGGQHYSSEFSESMAESLLSPPSHPEMLGRIGRYEVERMIGVGGMGVVFKAHDSELNRPVAIKLLAPYLAGSGPARKRFAREARAAAAVVHQHVVPIHNVESNHEPPFLVMHFVAGESLQCRIDREGALQVPEILRIGMQIAAGLSAAHQQGLVHRDIKPSNILLEEETVERALITDFGLARVAGDANATRSGAFFGTPQYMSPEQARGELVDPASDLFSLGSLLYTLATGRPPFSAETPYGIIRKISDEQPQEAREINPEIPQWLSDVISKLMSKQKADRFQSASSAHDLLKDCLNHVQQPTTVGLPEELRRLQPVRRKTIRGRGVRAMLMAIGSALALFASMIYYIQTNQGVVQVTVLDPSLQATISGETITAQDGNQTIEVRPGQHQLIIRRGDDIFKTDSFELERGGEVVFQVRLLPGEVSIVARGAKSQKLPLSNHPTKPIDEAPKAPVANTATDTQSDRDQPAQPTVEQASTDALVGECELSGRFADKRAILTIRNPTAQTRNAIFNYQVILTDSHEGNYPRDVLVLISGRMEMELAAGQSYNHTLPMVRDPDVTLSEDHAYDTSHINVSLKPLPLGRDSSPSIMRRGRPVVGDFPLTIAVWEYKDPIRFIDVKAVNKSKAVANRPVRFRKLMSAPQEVKKEYFSGSSKIAASDDLNYLIAGYYGCEMRTWNIAKESATSPVKMLSGDCTRLGFVPNSSTAWIMDYGGTLRLWNAETGELIRNDRGPSRGESSGIAPVFRSDGKLMASPNRQGELEFWDLENNREIKVHETRVGRLEMSPDDKYCLTYGWVPSIGRLCLSAWDPETGELAAGPFPAPGRVGYYSVKHSKVMTFVDGELVVRTTNKEAWPVLHRVKLPAEITKVHSLDDDTLLWEGEIGKDPTPEVPHQKKRFLYRVPINVDDPSQIELVSPPEFNPKKFVLDRQGGRWLNVTMNSVSCWEIGAKQPIWSKDIPLMSWQCRGVLGEGNWILVHDRSGPAFVFDIATGEEMWRKTYVHWAEVKGDSILVGDHEGASVWQFIEERDIEATSADRSSGKSAIELTSLRFPEVGVPVMAVTSDGQRFAAPRDDERLGIWDFQAGATVDGTNFPGARGRFFKAKHGWQIIGVAFSPDNKLVATASLDKTAMLWDVDSGDRIAVLEGHQDRLCFVTFSPSGKYLFTGSGPNRNTGCIWDGKTGKLIVELEGHTDKVIHARFTSDESRVLTGSRDNTARVWNVKEGRELFKLQHGSVITTAEFSPDEKTILTASSGRKSLYWTLNGKRANEGHGPSKEHSARLWDATSGKQKLLLDHPAGLIASFNKSATEVVTVCKDVITFWDSVSGKKLESLPTGGASRTSATFSPDRRLAVVFNQQKSAAVWNLEARRVLYELPTGDAVRNAFSSDSSIFYSLTRRGTFRAWLIGNEKPSKGRRVEQEGAEES